MEGGCLCGRVRYRLLDAPVAQLVCHCRSCQKQSGSAFSVVVVARASSFELNMQLPFFADTGDSGNAVHRHFCPDCGSPIMTVAPAAAKFVAVKAGTLDDAASVRPGTHVWCSSAWDWTPIPEDAVRFEAEPGAAPRRDAR